jgi:hypothetical protein
MQVKNVVEKFGTVLAQRKTRGKSRIALQCSMQNQLSD